MQVYNVMIPTSAVKLQNRVSPNVVRVIRSMVVILVVPRRIRSIVAKSEKRHVKRISLVHLVWLRALYPNQ